LNEAIPGERFMLIDDHGNNLGVLSREQAFFLASDSVLDVVEVSDNDPIVVRLMNFNKQRYDLEKQARKQRVKQKSGQMKEIKLSFKISEHDFQTRVRQAQKFLEHGDQVKLTMRLVGRENAFPDLAKEKFTRFASELGMQTGLVSKQGNRMNVVLRAA